jgi:hypothetical protein
MNVKFGGGKTDLTSANHVDERRFGPFLILRGPVSTKTPNNLNLKILKKWTIGQVKIESGSH